MTISALCTGGASGIGRATAIALAARGASVVVGDIDAEGGRETVRLIECAGGQARFELVDVSVGDEVHRFVSAAVHAHGRLDVAANVAGTHDGLGALTADVAEQDFDHQLSVNLRGMWLCVRAELRAMLSDGGSIVNVSSVDGLVAAEGAAPYAIAKSGILGLTRTAAVEYAQAGIRVNSVCPGLVDTPLSARAWPLIDPTNPDAARTRAITQIPARRMARAEEIATTIAWLCMDAPAYLTGANIVVDGGVTIQG
jgi:NAD(P)-dependent dehydrogenase (short-subunit alcohol dehydrogenase family)